MWKFLTGVAIGIVVAYFFIIKTEYVHNKCPAPVKCPDVSAQLERAKTDAQVACRAKLADSLEPLVAAKEEIEDCHSELSSCKDSVDYWQHRVDDLYRSSD